MQAAFGPFYRIEQLILSTTPAAQSPYQTLSGLPSILTDSNIRLLFQMQAAVDALAGPVAGSNASATLQQVCYKPLGDDCATQSILQVSHISAPRPRYSMPLRRMEATVNALDGPVAGSTAPLL